MDTKVCTRCGKEKEIIEFYIKSGSDTERRASCIECYSVASQLYRQKNKEKEVSRHKIYRQKNIKVLQQKRRDHYQTAKGEAKQYREKNKEKIKQYFIDNKERFLEYKSDYNWAYRIKKEYGIYPEQFYEMSDKQGGVCAICGREETESYNSTVRTGRLCIDHNHETGKLRGLLCMRCNRAMGMFQDNSILLRKASEYLEEYDNS